MKTKYEKLYKYDINNILFGMPKKKYRPFYLMIISFVVLLGLILEL